MIVVIASLILILIIFDLNFVIRIVILTNSRKFSIKVSVYTITTTIIFVVEVIVVIIAKPVTTITLKIIVNNCLVGFENFTAVDLKFKFIKNSFRIIIFVVTTSLVIFIANLSTYLFTTTINLKPHHFVVIIKIDSTFKAPIFNQIINNFNNFENFLVIIIVITFM